MKRSSAGWLDGERTAAGSRGWRIGSLLDIHQLQAEGSHPVKQGMQAGLVQLRGQYRGRGFHLDDDVGKRLTGRGP
jgi:hypothetical protein